MKRVPQKDIYDDNVPAIPTGRERDKWPSIEDFMLHLDRFVFSDASGKSIIPIEPVLALIIGEKGQPSSDLERTRVLERFLRVRRRVGTRSTNIFTLPFPTSPKVITADGLSDFLYGLAKYLEVNSHLGFEFVRKPLDQDRLRVDWNRFRFTQLQRYVYKQVGSLTREAANTSLITIGELLGEAVPGYREFTHSPSIEYWRQFPSLLTEQFTYMENLLANVRFNPPTDSTILPGKAELSEILQIVWGRYFPNSPLFVRDREGHEFISKVNFARAVWVLHIHSQMKEKGIVIDFTDTGKLVRFETNYVYTPRFVRRPLGETRPAYMNRHRQLVSKPEQRGVNNIPKKDRLVPMPPKRRSYKPQEPSQSFTPQGVDAVGLYLKEMGVVPLLSQEDEFVLAARMIEGAKARVKMRNKKLPPQTRSELNTIKQRGEDARNRLIEANTRLVVSIAKRYIGKGVPFLDLIQEGNVGLMRATEKYDYTLGYRFSTYATWWIRQSVTRAVAEQGRTIRIPVHMVDRIRLMHKTAGTLEQKHGRPPTTEELAEALGTDSESVQWMIQVSWLPLSLESPVGDDEESELGMFIEDTNSPEVGRVAFENILAERMDEVLGTLMPREARILMLRFGLEDGTEYTLEEIGSKFKLTRERIRQIEGKALNRLRHPRRARRLQSFL